MLQMLGILMLALPGMGLIRFVGAVLAGIGSVAVLLGVPALFVNGRGGAQAFVVAFGVLFVLSRLLLAALFPLANLVMIEYGFAKMSWCTIALLLLGMAFLAPIKKTLFNEAPAVRRIAFDTPPRSPWLAGLASLAVPALYYLIHRYHGEVRLRPTGDSDRVEVMWWSHCGKWEQIGCLGPLVMPVNEAMDHICQGSVRLFLALEVQRSAVETRATANG